MDKRIAAAIETFRNLVTYTNYEPKCKECHDTGYINFEIDGYLYSKECKCRKIERAWTAINKCNLDKAIERHRFDNYETPEKWQVEIKGLAEQFAADTKGNWFFIGGQDGSGKTHICTAIVGRLFEQGIPVRYMMWMDASAQLKASATEAEDYQNLILPFKNADVLYIDDLFKTGDRIDERSKSLTYPTPADIKLAFEILNYRYLSDKTTIISSQRCLREIMDIDSALGGRIYERAGDYCIDIKGANKNYRIGN